MFLRDLTGPPSMIGVSPMVKTAEPSANNHWSQPQITRRAPGLSPRDSNVAPLKYEEPCEIPKRFHAADKEFDMENASFFANAKPAAALMYNQDTEWLTVSGFPQDAIASVRQFIEQKLNCTLSVRTTEGNYMHIRVPTVEAYHQCLSLSGEMLFGTLIIAVWPCRQRDILDGVSVEPQTLKTVVPLPRQNKFLEALLDFLFET